MNIQIEKPFPDFALPRLWAWIEEFRERVADDFFPKTFDSFATNWLAYEKAGRTSWAVFVDGELGGAITSAPTGSVSRDVHCIFIKKYWDYRTPLEALAKVGDELFGTGTLKISTMAFADNHALISIVRGLGGAKEGLLKNQTVRGGKLVDQVILGFERDRFYELRRKHAVGQQRPPDVAEQSVQPIDEHKRPIEHRGNSGDQLDDLGQRGGKSNPDSGTASRTAATERNDFKAIH